MAQPPRRTARASANELTVPRILGVSLAALLVIVLGVAAQGTLQSKATSAPTPQAHLSVAQIQAETIAGPAMPEWVARDLGLFWSCERATPGADRCQTLQQSLAQRMRDEHIQIDAALWTPPATPTPTASATVTKTSATAPSAGTTENGCAVTPISSQAETYLLGLLNQHRADAGVAPFTLDDALSSAARAHSCDMFQHQALNHTGTDGSSPPQRIGAAGVSFGSYGENIAWSYNPSITQGITDNDHAMMAEPLTPYTHHWNIVQAAFTRVGVGIVVANGQEWLTEDFVG